MIPPPVPKLSQSDLCDEKNGRRKAGVSNVADCSGAYDPLSPGARSHASEGAERAGNRANGGPGRPEIANPPGPSTCEEAGSRRCYTLRRRCVTWCYIRCFARDVHENNGVGGELRHGVTSGVSHETS